MLLVTRTTMVAPTPTMLCGVLSALWSMPTVITSFNHFLSMLHMLIVLVAISKDEYLETVGPTMVAEEGGDLRFYERQIEELEWIMGNDVEELYRALGG